MKNNFKSLVSKVLIFTMVTSIMLTNFKEVMAMTQSFTSEKVTNSENSHQYQVFNESMSWLDAKKYCENIGGYLATVTSESEQKFMEKLISDKGTMGSYHIGGTDEEQEGQFKWITGEAFDYTNWYPNEGKPNNKYGNSNLEENYMHIWKHGFKWFDQPNEHPYTYLHGFICEWGASDSNIKEVKQYNFRYKVYKDNKIVTGSDTLKEAIDQAARINNSKIVDANRVTLWDNSKDCYYAIQFWTPKCKSGWSIKNRTRETASYTNLMDAIKAASKFKYSAVIRSSGVFEWNNFKPHSSIYQFYASTNYNYGDIVRNNGILEYNDLNAAIKEANKYDGTKIINEKGIIIWNKKVEEKEKQEESTTEEESRISDKKAYGTSKNNPFVRRGKEKDSTAHVWGRILEKFNEKLSNSEKWFVKDSAQSWWEDNINLYERTNGVYGYEYGDIPRPNSIAIWTGNGNGQVAFVDKIEGRGTNAKVHFYNGNTYVKTQEQMKKNGNLTLKGYIYFIPESQIEKLSEIDITILNRGSDAYGDASVNPFINRGKKGQSTAFVWGRINEKFSEILSESQKYFNDDNTAEWIKDSESLYKKSNGKYGYKVGQTPKENAIAVWTGKGNGHVAFIEKVEGTNHDADVYFTEANWLTYTSKTNGGGYDGFVKVMKSGDLKKRDGLTLKGYIYFEADAVSLEGDLSAEEINKQIGLKRGQVAFGNKGNSKGPQYNPFLYRYGGQCTSYVWGRICQKFSEQLSYSKNYFTGNAKTWWTDNLKLYKNSKGKYGYEYDSTGNYPRANSIAVWGNTRTGHVAFVEKVEGNKVYYTEGNVETYSSKNGDRGGGYDGYVKVSTIEGMKQRGKRKLLGYIYFVPENEANTNINDYKKDNTDKKDNTNKNNNPKANNKNDNNNISKTDEKLIKSLLNEGKLRKYKTYYISGSPYTVYEVRDLRVNSHFYSSYRITDKEAKLWYGNIITPLYVKNNKIIKDSTTINKLNDIHFFNSILNENIFKSRIAYSKKGRRLVMGWKVYKGVCEGLGVAGAAYLENPASAIKKYGVEKVKSLLLNYDAETIAAFLAYFALHDSGVANKNTQKLVNSVYVYGNNLEYNTARRYINYAKKNLRLEEASLTGLLEYEIAPVKETNIFYPFKLIIDSFSSSSNLDDFSKLERLNINPKTIERIKSLLKLLKEYNDAKDEVEDAAKVELIVVRIFNELKGAGDFKKYLDSKKAKSISEKFIETLNRESKMLVNDLTDANLYLGTFNDMDLKTKYKFESKALKNY